MRVENLHGKVFDKVIIGVADQIFRERDRVVRLRIHEMIAVAILIRKFELFPLDLDQLDFVGGTKADIGAFAGVDVADDGLHERSQIPRRAMMDFKHNGGIAIVFDGHSSAQIVGGGHGKVER